MFACTVLTDIVFGLLSAEWTVLPLVMVRDDLLMTGDTSFAAKHFNSLIPNALGAAGTPVSHLHLYSTFARPFISATKGGIAPAAALCPSRHIA
jgi:hypothetical protein